MAIRIVLLLAFGAAGVNMRGMESKGIVSKLSFERQLLVCNAYAADRPIKVEKNSKMDLTTSKPLAYKECRNLGANVLNSGDRLGFHFVGDDDLSGGMFKVGDELPMQDTMMLLVVERTKGASHQMKFQSFAFPSSGKGAHVAVIDTFHGLHDAAALTVVDHKNKDEKKDTKKGRHENLNFNRVYELESGTYDVSNADGKPHTVKLENGQDYVFIQTGDEVGFPTELSVFPKESGANSLVASLAVLIALARLF